MDPVSRWLPHGNWARTLDDMPGLHSDPRGGRALRRRDVLRGAGALSVAALLTRAPATAAADATPLHETFWRSGGFGGYPDGTTATAAGLVIGTATGRRTYADPYGGGTATYESASWTSPVATAPFAWRELVASWNADTPVGTWVEVSARGVDAAGQASPWFVMGRWCAADPAWGGAIQRTSVAGQSSAYGAVATDTLTTTRGYPAYQLQVTLLRKAGTAATPTVRLVGANVSGWAPGALAALPTSTFGGTVRTLGVPTYSQEVHAGHYPGWGGGGESWCSATTTAMILDYWGAGPSAADRSWVRPAVDSQVDYAARCVYDAAYGGTGNWPFNTAYAGTMSRGTTRLDGYVTRLRDLAAAEPFIAAGVPLGVSLSFTGAQLSGAGYGTDGHLMVLVGFDSAGNPVVNDPASHMRADNAAVRTTYQRAQFERAWSNSGRTAYVVRPSPPASAPPPPTAPPTSTPAGPAVQINPGGRAIARRR